MQIPVLDERFLERPALAANILMWQQNEWRICPENLCYPHWICLKHMMRMKEAQVTELEETVDHYEDQIGSYLVQLSSKNLSDTDSRSLTMLLHCIGDFERISDHAVSLMRSAKEMQEKNLHFSRAGRSRSVGVPFRDKRYRRYCIFSICNR